jgi:glycosyltransferase involved in cell wall biosynthesis
VRILHGTYEIAGQGMVLADGLRAAGAEADSLAYRVDWDGRRPRLIVDLDGFNPIRRTLEMFRTRSRLAPAYDVFHFHFGSSFFGSGAPYAGSGGLARLLARKDVPGLKARGKTVVFHFHGCEVRNRALMLARHERAACTECRPFCDPERQRILLADAARHADRVFFSTKDLAESVPNGIELPLAIDAARWEEAARAFPLPAEPWRDGVHGPVVIAHAPTNRWIKGTRHIEAAVETLQAEFPLLELRLIDHIPWAEMPRALAACDLLVDQLFMGWYGLLAIEGMSLGKPVVCHLRADFVAAAPGCPVVDATAETLVDVLRPLIADPARRAGLGAAGQAWARARHDAAVVGRTLLAHYEEIRR